MFPWGFAISTQVGPRTPDEGRKKGQLCRKAFPEGKGSPTESLFPKNLSSLVDCSNPALVPGGLRQCGLECLSSLPSSRLPDLASGPA